jgi:hypothetical protein
MDLTGQILDRAAQVGESLGEDKEDRILNVVAGIISTYNRKNRGVVATYGDNSGSHDWDNLAATNALVDWTDVEAAKLLFDAMTDPNTGIPLANMGGQQLLVATGLSMTANRVINATEIEHVDNQTNAATIRTRSTNPLTGYSAMSTPRLSAIQGNQTTWYLGNFKKAFTYYQWWGITTSQQGAGSEAEFTRDIVAQYKEPGDEPKLTSVTEQPEDNRLAVSTGASADVKFVTEKPFELVENPKTAPLYDFVVTIGVERKDYVYEVTANDEADAIRKVFDFSEGLKAIASKVRRHAKRKSWTPTNVERLTTKQVEALNGLTDEEKLPLFDKAIQEKKAA